MVFGKATGFGAALDLSTLDGSNGFRIDGIDTSDFSGRALSSAGDVNGDGFDDILIGAYGADPGGNTYAGESYVIFGSRSLKSVTITGTRLSQTHNGGFGDDVINALDGDDTVKGWEGDDDLNGSGGNDTIDGGSGDDEIFGGSGNDTLKGGSDNDVLHGGSGNDTLIGGSGTDETRGGSGNDTYITDGFDTVIEAVNSGADFVRSTATLALGNNLEHLTLLGTLISTAQVTALPTESLATSASTRWTVVQAMTRLSAARAATH